MQIFGEYHPIFDLLDSNHNLLIDQLELFAAMALFSRLVALPDKVEFIFTLFDFNALRSLSLTDLEFLAITCVAVARKLLGVKSGVCEEDVILFVNQEFEMHQRVNISQMKSWAAKSQEVAKFLAVINGE